MLVCARTTIDLPDGLVEAAKDRAATTGRTFTSLVEEGLRLVVEQAAAAERTPVADPLPSFGDPHGRALVDLTDRDAVWAALDAEDHQ